MPTTREKLATKKSKLAGDRPKQADHPANFNNYADGSFYHIPLEVISPDPEQPRKTFDEQALEELAQSIKQNGVLQPVIVRPDQGNQGRFCLVAGERRWRAARIAGLAEIPAIISQGNPREISLIENIQREDLRPMEQAEAFQEMTDKYGYTQDQLAQVIGKARTTVTEILSLNRLPAEIREECRRADIPRRVLVEIAKQPSEKAMQTLFAKVKLSGLKSDQVRNLTRAGRENRLVSPASSILYTTGQLIGLIGKTDWAVIDGEERGEVLARLQKLQDMISRLLV